MNKVLLFLVALLLAVLAVGMFLPSQVHVERSITVDRPKATVFTLLNSFRTFNQWSPWAQRDPDAEYRYSGPPSGVGARLDWSGDPAQVGTGWQEIIYSKPFDELRMQLDFGEQGRAESYFLIREIPTGSEVTWGFDSDVTAGQGFFGAILGRYFGLFFDQWVGGDYAQGLVAFRQFAESLPAQDFSAARITGLVAEPQPILFVSGSASHESGAIATALATAYGELSSYMSEQGIAMAGQPMAITRDWSDEMYRFDAAIPVAEGEYELSGNVQYGLSPAGPAVRVEHVGPYDESTQSYDALFAWMAAHGVRQGNVSWEHYISDPGDTPAEEIITHIYFLVDESP